MQLLKFYGLRLAIFVWKFLWRRRKRKVNLANHLFLPFHSSVYMVPTFPVHSPAYDNELTSLYGYRSPTCSTENVSNGHRTEVSKAASSKTCSTSTVSILLHCCFIIRIHSFWLVWITSHEIIGSPFYYPKPQKARFLLCARTRFLLFERNVTLPSSYLCSWLKFSELQRINISLAAFSTMA